MGTLLSRADLKLLRCCRETQTTTAIPCVSFQEIPQLTLGGREATAAGASYTAFSLLGHLPTVKIDVLRMRRLTRSTGNDYEVQYINMASAGRFTGFDTTTAAPAPYGKPCCFTPAFQ